MRIIVGLIAPTHSTARALLGDPELLILDQPASGLDPAGIRWMRDLLRGYAARGSTVLLSSHLLHEILHGPSETCKVAAAGEHDEHACERVRSHRRRGARGTCIAEHRL